MRRSGESFAHPLLVLIYQAGTEPVPRFAITAGASVGNAVQRNRAKRLLRAALQEHLPAVQPGIEGILIAREPLVKASFSETAQALGELLMKAGIHTSEKK